MKRDSSELVSRDTKRSYRNPKSQVLSIQGEIDDAGLVRMIALVGDYRQLPKPLRDPADLSIGTIRWLPA